MPAIQGLAEYKPLQIYKITIFFLLSDVIHLHFQIASLLYSMPFNSWYRFASPGEFHITNGSKMLKPF